MGAAVAIAAPQHNVSAESLTLVQENVARVIPVHGGGRGYGGYGGRGYGGYGGYRGYGGYGGYHGGYYRGYGYGGYRGYGGYCSFARPSTMKKLSLPSPQVRLQS